MLRPTLSRKIGVGFTLTLFTGALAAVLIFDTLSSISHSLEDVTAVQQPLAEAGYELEVNATGSGLGVLRYLETGDRRYLGRVRDERADLARSHARYARLARTPDERRLAARLATLFDRFTAVGDSAIASERQRRLLDRRPRRLDRDRSVERERIRDTERLFALQGQIDSALDGGVQARRTHALAAAGRAAEAAADRGLVRLLALLGLASLLVVAVGVAVTRHLVGRIRRLTEGTEAVARGDLGHRIAVLGRDEITSLTRNFNRMVTELEATMVSKTALEQNQERLRSSVGALEREVDDRRRAEVELAREKQHVQVTLDSIGDAVIRIDTGGRVLYLNPKAEELTRWTDAEAHGESLERVLRSVEETTGDSASDLVGMCLRDGEPRASSHTVLAAGPIDGPRHAGFAAELSVAPIRDPDDPEHPIVGVVLAFRDVSAQRELAAQLSYQATHDALTGLCNRAEFELRVERALTGATEGGERHVVCYLDLDQFKVVNDTCGHIAGDRLLKELAAELRADVRDTDTLARLGGDEFGVLLQHCPADEGLVVAEKLRRLITELRFDYRGRALSVGASVGVVPLTARSGSLAGVLSAADAACYAAKDAGRNRVQLYHDEDIGLARRQGEMEWVNRINDALAEDRFLLHFQRIAPIRSGPEAADHHEILVRMLDERGELVPPGKFIPAAERYGLMAAVDRWVIAHSLGVVAERHGHRPGGPLERYSINLSGASLGDATCLAFIRQQLARHPVPPEAYCFEVTETAAIAQLGSAIEFMEELKGLGCRFSLDDFGSGLSSFAYLKTLPVDFVKIDGAFVKDMAEDPIDYAMVEAINRVGQVMGIRTIAEFVEDQAILDLLARIGVDYAQGYHIGRPGPAEQTLTPAIATNGHGAPVGAARR